MRDFEKEYQRWLASPVLTEDEKSELMSIADNDELREFRFSSPMSFGTAGLRSTMYLGVACMNRFTVAGATRGIAALVKQCGAENRGVAIAYDSRNNSREFAIVSASVLAGAGIKVYIFDDIRPTPELSYAVRKTGAIAGINITASHNPKEYNGYKAYWEDGAQLSPEHAAVVAEESAKYDPLDMSNIADFDEAVRSGLVCMLGENFDNMYLEEVMKTAINPSLVSELGDSFKVVYTPLHGAGRRLVPLVFERIGLKHLYTVESQMVPDGNFPTVKKPNPEYREVFSEGIELADKVGADLIIATDPDSDRVGVMTRTDDGSFATITGNQMGALLLDYAITERKNCGKLPPYAFAVKSIVSTDMAYKIAETHGVKLHDVLTGFKYIGETIKNYEKIGKEDGFVLGFEESYGYLLGTYARDKDAVEASMLILEMAAYYAKCGLTLNGALDQLYKKYGFFGESVTDIYFEGLDGIAKRKNIMQSLRDNVPGTFGGIEVKTVADYAKGRVYYLSGEECGVLDQPKSDVLYYTLVNDDKIIVRPSGTKPKIKIYVLAHADNKKELEEKSQDYLSDAKKYTEI